MNYRRYFLGQSLQLQSPLSAEDVARRINQEAGSLLWPFSLGVVGGSYFGHLRLRYRSSPFEYNAKPVLAGRLGDTANGKTHVKLRYRAPIWVYGFYVLWYSILALIALVIAATGFTPSIDTGGVVMFFIVFVTLAFSLPLIHMFGTRQSDEELSYLIDFLAEAAAARQTPSQSLQNRSSDFATIPNHKKRALVRGCGAWPGNRSKIAAPSAFAGKGVVLVR